MPAPDSRAAAGFDAVAGDYDAAFTRTAIGLLLRGRVWRSLNLYTAQSTRMTALELNCGTGEDTVWLADEAGKCWRRTSRRKWWLPPGKRLSMQVEDLVRAEVCAMENIGRINQPTPPQREGRRDVKRRVRRDVSPPVGGGVGGGVDPLRLRWPELHAFGIA